VNLKRTSLFGVFVTFEILSILSALVLYSTDWQRELSGADTFIKIVMASSVFVSLLAANGLKRSDSAPMWIAVATSFAVFLLSFVIRP
jgi:hypothetical protein